MEKPVALQYRVMRRENFEKAPEDLVELLRSTQAKWPDRPRVLYVDIDGHRNENGGFDDDMLELQGDFGVDFLGPFFTEIHFPLGAFRNTGVQRNDVPKKLNILNGKNEKDDGLHRLYIENYENTEFMSEPDVYRFLEHFSDFLKTYGAYTRENRGQNADENIWLYAWKRHTYDLIRELFTAFLYGNLLSASAMTRSLIECYVYLSIIQKEKDVPLMDEWYICNLCLLLRDDAVRAKELVQAHCEKNHLDFQEKWDAYKDNQNANAWLRLVIADKRISFRKACDYLGEAQIYQDFQSASAFVHGQDIISKMSPFAFYNSIFNRLYIMVSYIFKTIRLFPVSEALGRRMESLETELLELGETYGV